MGKVGTRRILGLSTRKGKGKKEGNIHPRCCNILDISLVHNCLPLYVALSMHGNKALTLDPLVTLTISKNMHTTSMSRGHPTQN